MPSTRPRPEEYPTWWRYHQAKRLWLRRHGGHLWTTLAIATFFGLLSGSAIGLLVLVAFALVGSAYARSRP